jgi:hypothetical protein
MLVVEKIKNYSYEIIEILKKELVNTEAERLRGMYD